MCPYVLLLPDTFPHQKDRFSYFNANLVKVFEKANGLHEKSHCSLCGGAMAEQVFPKLFIADSRQKTC